MIISSVMIVSCIYTITIGGIVVNAAIMIITITVISYIIISIIMFFDVVDNVCPCRSPARRAAARRPPIPV